MARYVVTGLKKLGQGTDKAGFQVIRFGNTRHHGVIRALIALFQQLDETVYLAGATTDDIHQLVPGQMHGAGRRDQQPVTLQQAQTQLVQAGIGLLAGFLVTTAGDQCRRVQDDDIELLFIICQALEHLEGIALQGVHIIEPVERSVMVHRGQSLP